MADTPPLLVSLISDLPDGPSALDGDELVEIQKGTAVGSSQKITAQQIADLVPPPVYPVTKVNGKTGEVELVTTDIDEGTNKYYTDTRNARSPVTALSIVAGVVNIDLSLGSYFTLALTANVTGFTFSNLPAAGIGQTASVRMQQDATGGRTVAFPASFHQITGGATAVGSAANSYTLLMFTSFDQGTRWEYTMQATVD